MATEKKTVEDAIEMLRCAEVNCDNVKRIGVNFADFVKLQVQEAITILEGVSDAQ